MEEKEVQGAPVHKRRVRYSGTHPRRFEEKYKEQNPEKYADTIEKVIKKGSTPAGMHISICVKGAGRHTWIRRSHDGDIKKAGRTGAYVCS